ncbi:MAG TPA: DMT family transporter [Candidatus Aminicenantes bacterium]|nr:DMT family transporter [Candidatus Aminicenantes bacterium]HEB35670.1 DMT family transporter [Candidatus Aminicenantes bacterium]
MEKPKEFGATDIFMLLAILCWAINFSFMKIALREFSPLAFNGLRLLFASLILITALFVRGEGFSVAKSDIPKILFLSIIGNTVFQLLFMHGLNWTTASNTSVIMAMTPVFVVILSVFLKQEKIHWAGWLGIVISFIGFYFIITKQAGTFHFSWEELRGDLMILICNLFWAIYTVFSKPFLEKISPLKWTTITLAIGTVFYLPFAALDIVRIQWSEISFQAWAVLFYSGLFPIAICYVVWYASVRRVGNSKTAIYGYLSPIFTILFAYLLISERITLLQIGGALIIFAGVYLTRSGYRLLERRKASELSE